MVAMLEMAIALADFIQLLVCVVGESRAQSPLFRRLDGKVGFRVQRLMSNNLRVTGAGVGETEEFRR
jgi:hypothetical protein